ncbi:hypothetical protein [Thermosipho atlanticus]|uniref:Uncharacterized protein n=2 Tax=Thermosipho atlanticus DSM 15807 TaxID=1123380 RepID=A0A1M5TU85_9BACT|nr:hypothetical protein [Thermosipho atlanticus]SHH43692.1 hypothetical protein SAMN02745199_1076 [Thermosipho atlanticus DSM 15807]SHH54238.1 hypothetical protein SAMN02745199_1474 [Thermosipho atlanticus DSM 15807]
MFKKISVVLLTVLVLTASIFAVGPWRSNYVQTNTTSRTQPLYQNLPEGATVSETTISGTVKEIEMIPGEGMEVIIDAEGEEYEVHTGPIWLYDGLEVGVNIEISGRIISTEDETYIVVDKAVIDGKEIVVRENGFPVFARRGMENNRGNTYTEMERRNVRGRMMNRPQNKVREHAYGYGMGTCVYDAD